MQLNATLFRGMVVSAVLFAAPAGAQSDAISAQAGMPSISVPASSLSPAARHFVAGTWAPGVDPAGLVARGQSLGAFLDEVTGPPLQSYEACSAAFANLSGQSYELVASVRASGRFCNLIVVVEKSSTGITVGQLQVWDIPKVKDALYRSGNSTLLAVWQPWSPYEGTRACMASFPALYRYQAGGFIDVSSQARSFYQDMLVKAEKNAASSAAQGRAESDCDLMELYRLRRTLDPQSAAESQLAISWAKSPDPARRAKAAVMLGDAGGPGAKNLLMTLRSDPEPGVAAAAQGALASMQH
ncbi:MAG TPA: hypothetical protein VMH86_12310 [Rhizomicrobium sp.]|nr:hypothetical protein [Rhizomicrobium sp.]